MTTRNLRKHKRDPPWPPAELALSVWYVNNLTYFLLKITCGNLHMNKHYLDFMIFNN